jgi:hypothetical protein
MTPQLTLLPNMVPRRPGAAHLTPAHLTEDQFGELLSVRTSAVYPALASAEAHLLACEQCAAELAGLRESLSLFRMASNAHADNELRQMPRVSLPVRGAFSPALEPTWWVAAAAVFLAAILPMQSLRQHTFRSAPAVSVTASDSATESDEALLEDVDRDTSASVPAPMQALADPTGSISSTASVSTSVQRKD